jgi:hypothetical protein
MVDTWGKERGGGKSEGAIGRLRDER